MKRSRISAIYISIFFVLLCLNVKAQEILTLEEAVEITLENNFEIRLAKNDSKVDELSVSPGFAGILPRVFASADTNNSNQNISQTRSDGTQINLDNAKNNNISYGVGLDWTIFDGLQMFARYDQLKELEKLGKAELQNTILTRVGDVMTTYYKLVQQRQEFVALENGLLLTHRLLRYQFQLYRGLSGFVCRM